MIEVTTLNNMFPPTWDGDQAPLDSINTENSVESELRHFRGHDFFNYWTMQRTEGDLFKRDLILSQDIRAIVNLLSSRFGNSIDSGDVVLPYHPLGSYHTVGRIYIPSGQFVGGWVNALGVRGIKFSGSGVASDVSLVVVEVNGSGVAIDTITDATSTVWFASNITDRGVQIETGKNYDIRLVSAAPSDVSCSAFVNWQHRINS
jgi:hypothetical protein